MEESAGPQFSTTADLDGDGDGQPDVIASAGGALVWFEATGSIVDQWSERTIFEDGPQPSASAPSSTDPNVSAEGLPGETFMNSITVTISMVMAGSISPSRSTAADSAA